MNLPEYLTFDDVNIIPSYSDIESRKECDVSTWLGGDWKLRIPLIASPMDTVTGHDMAAKMHELGGLGILHRFCTIEEQIAMIPKVKSTNEIPLAAAIGIRDIYQERAEALVDAGIQVLLIDVAHGHHSDVSKVIGWLAAVFKNKITIIAGNVATSTGVQFLRNSGADVVRVGIGNGSLCETRIRTGVGVPQFSALVDCTNIVHPLIADGGMRTPGDVAKALGIGASSCMIGSLFAGTRESPGPLQRVGQFPNETLFKSYRGSASRSAKLDSGQSEGHIEGNSTMIPYKGKVDRIVQDILDGLRSAMSYVGARDLNEFSRKATFARVTHAGQIEAQPHLLL